MVDREKTALGIREMLMRDTWRDIDANRPRYQHILNDALALLKEQEPVRVGKKIKAGDVVLDFYQCGHCKNAIRKPWRYCPFCGKAVKWNDK